MYQNDMQMVLLNLRVKSCCSPRKLKCPCLLSFHCFSPSPFSCFILSIPLPLSHSLSLPLFLFAFCSFSLPPFLSLPHFLSYPFLFPSQSQDKQHQEQVLRVGEQAGQNVTIVQKQLERVCSLACEGEMYAIHVLAFEYLPCLCYACFHKFVGCVVLVFCNEIFLLSRSCTTSFSPSLCIYPSSARHVKKCF